MTFDVTKLVHRSLALAFGFGAPIVREFSYYRPPAAPPLASCTGIIVPVRSAMFLGFVTVNPGTEILIVRCAEMPGVTPAVGDYLIEQPSGIRRNVVAARADLTDEFFSLQCERA